MVGASLRMRRSRLAWRSRFVALFTLFTALTTIAAAPAPFTTAAAFGILAIAWGNRLPLVDRRDGLLCADRLVLTYLGLARRALLLRFAPSLARLRALAVSGRLAIATLLRLSALGRLSFLPVALTFTLTLALTFARLTALLVTRTTAITLVAAPASATLGLARDLRAHR
jgi:hypothetical protein